MKKYQSWILLFFIFLIFYCVQNFGQTPKSTPKDSKKDRQDEMEVTKFADAFLESFIKTQDLKKISSSFFDKDFTNRFANSGDCMLLNDKIKNYSQEELYKTNTIFHNFVNLLTITIVRNFDKEKHKDSDSDNLYLKFLPLKILSKIKKSKWLKNIILEDGEEPKDHNEIQEFIKEMSAISDEMRLYLAHHPIINSPNFQKLKKENFKYYPADFCEKDSCFGLPEKTPIFAVHELLMCLRIAKINGQLKVVQIYSVACES
ncbi:MAG: hypothetical protein K1X72_17885 [Pyrinomonadaceae bacterium]|nr:hypothetical protein [Pyrinomonadaceae bacterium]